MSLPQSIEAFQQTNAKVVPLPMRKAVWGLEATEALVRLIRAEGFDIVHIHSQEAALLGRLVAWASGAPKILYTPQTLDIRRSRWHGLYRLIERLLSHITTTIISVNEADRRRLIGWGITPRKVVTIHNGVDLARFCEQIDVASLRQSLGLDGRFPLVMQVGRLSAQKDPLAFVDGAARVLSQRPGTQFALVGDGPLRDAVLARIRELGVEKHVCWLGWRTDAYRLIGAADVATLTSRWEGTPYALLEAMAWSRPVVATAVNGCPEIVVEGETGFLVPPGDLTAWAGRVITVLQDPAQAKTMGNKGREQVEARFTLKQMLGRLEALYSDVGRCSTPR